MSAWPPASVFTQAKLRAWGCSTLTQHTTELWTRRDTGPQGGWNCFYWGERGRPAMVRLVFCPRRQPKPSASTRHLPGLVEHAKLSQRVEVGVEPPGPGVMEQERVAPAGWPGWHGPPRPRPGPTRGLRLPGRGRQAAPGEGCPAGLGGQKPTGAPPYLAGTPERWVMASLSPEGSISRPRSASLGPAWGANRDTVGTY